MQNKIRVHGKAQNRTALGIVNAYLVLFPKATLEDLKQAFPDSLNPDSGVKVNFVDMKKVDSVNTENWNGFFTAEDEVLHLADGTTVAVVKMWTKTSFERLVNQAAKYGIEIASFEQAEKGIGRKGGFTLEYINGWTPEPEIEAPKRKSKAWIWILAAVLLLCILGFVFFKCNGKSDTAPIAKPVTKVVAKKKTITKQVEKIQKDFNAAQFTVNNAELNDSAKIILNNLADLLKSHSQVKVNIIGHASAEGNAEHNQKLSEERAKAAFDYLVELGVNASQLSYEGKGSSEPIDSIRPELNRRTEFIVK